MSRIRIATAGWAAPRTVRHRFPEAASGLQRYAGRFHAAEINTSFYRSHRPSTWARWAEDTPAGFRFAAKAPKTITHDRRLTDSSDLFDAFLAEARGLGDKLGPILVQLPPSLAFDAAIAGRFLDHVRSRYEGALAWEPRHPTWFEAEADTLLTAQQVARVAADPLRHPKAGEPGGWTGLAYWRLHGSPRMYYSAYDQAYLQALAERLKGSSADEVWCVFDNTTSGAAAENALDLAELLAG